MNPHAKRRVSVVVYMLAAFGLCLIALAAVMAITTAASFRSERGRASIELHAAARSVATAEAQTAPQTVDFLRGMAAQPGINSLDKAKCDATFESLNGLFSYAGGMEFSLELVAPDGSHICELRSRPRPAAPAPPGPWFNKVQETDAPVVGDVVLSRATGKPQFTLAVPVDAPQGTGVLALMTDTQFQPVEVPAGSPRETVIIELDEDRKIVLSASANAPAQAGAVKSGFWLSEPLGAGRTVTDSDGVTRMYQEVHSPELNRYVLAGVSSNVALGAAQAILRRNMLLGFVVIVLVAGLGVLMHRRVARPIRNLQDSIRAAAADRHVRAVPEGPDEIAALAEAFNATIDERLKLELELAAALTTANEASRLKSEFLANMSHEIRTPMNGVLGMLSVMQEQDLTPEQVDYLSVMGESADSLMTIINDLLDFSKIEVGMVQVAHEPFSLRGCVSAAVTPWSSVTASTDVELVTHVDDGLPDVFIGDTLRIRQVLSNLVDNAVKFTPAGRVTVRIAPEDGMVRFEVCDTGIGIAAEGRDRLFEPFVQADGSTTRCYGGTGLGLSICRQLVELMQGEIGVESAAGFGSRFWFRLPLSASSEPLPAASRAAVPSRRPPVQLGSAAKRVLVVEDNLINQKVAVRLLAQLGYAADVAGDGLEALRALACAPYDAVLMDIQMPRMDGYEATREIRRQWSDLPIVALTASAMEEDRQRCLACGMDAYLAKPVARETLRMTLEDVLTAAQPVVTGPAS